VSALAWLGACIGPAAGNSSGAALDVDARALCRHIKAMNKLRSAALTTTATAYGGSPAGCAR